VLRSDPRRGLGIIEQRAKRKLGSPQWPTQVGGVVTLEFACEVRGGWV